jgi:hypothetical protein
MDSAVSQRRPARSGAQRIQTRERFSRSTTARESASESQRFESTQAQPGQVSELARVTRPEAAASSPAPVKREERSAGAGEATADVQPRPPAQPTRAPVEDRGPLLEARALARAEGLLTTHPAQSLAILEELSRAARHEYLSEEREYIEIMALYGLGRRADADRTADHFLARYRSSVFRERLQAARTAAASRP